MRITSSLRFLYIFDQSGLLCGGSCESEHETQVSSQNITLFWTQLVINRTYSGSLGQVSYGPLCASLVSWSAGKRKAGKPFWTYHKQQPKYYIN